MDYARRVVSVTPLLLRPSFDPPQLYNTPPPTHHHRPAFKLAPPTQDPLPTPTPSHKRPRPSSPLTAATNPSSSSSPSSLQRPLSKRTATTPTPDLAHLHITPPSSSRPKMALTSQAKSLYAELQRHQLHPDQVPTPTPQLNNLLNQLKIHLAESGLLFPTASASTEQEKADLLIARDVLEFGALFSIKTEDVPSFERYMALLSAFYAQPEHHLPPSQNRAALSALSLLRLLSQNRIAEFHTTLETLSPELLLSRELTWVLELERSLMEGSYSKVYSLCSNPSNLPRVEFKYFISTLLSTVRSEIASCDERAYATLPLRDAQTLLFFSNEADVRAFAKERGWSVDEAKGIIRFGGVQSGPLKGNKSTEAGGGLGGDKEIHKERIVASVVGYAKELESIV